MINQELDIKILILYALDKLPGKIDSEAFYDVVSANGVGYFEYADFLSDLVENGNIYRNEDAEIEITSMGRKNAEAVKSELPFSVRRKTDRLIAPMAERIRRQELIVAESSSCRDGVMVHLKLNDGTSDLVDMSVLVADENQAAGIKKKFKKSAEKIYKEIIEQLL